MKQILVILSAVVLVGCGEKPTEEVFAEEASADEGEGSHQSTPHIGGDRPKFLRTKAKAEAGDADAQFSLYMMYSLGEGVQMDGKEGVKWCRKASRRETAFQKLSWFCPAM